MDVYSFGRNSGQDLLAFFEWFFIKYQKKYKIQNSIKIDSKILCTLDLILHYNIIILKNRYKKKINFVET